MSLHVSLHVSLYDAVGLEISLQPS